MPQLIVTRQPWWPLCSALLDCKSLSMSGNSACTACWTSRGDEPRQRATANHLAKGTEGTGVVVLASKDNDDVSRRPMDRLSTALQQPDRDIARDRQVELQGHGSHSQRDESSEFLGCRSGRWKVDDEAAPRA